MNFIKSHLFHNLKEAEFPTESITLLSLAGYAFLFLQDLKQVHLHAAGVNFEEIHKKADELYDELNDQFDTICEMGISEGYDIYNFANIRSYITQDDWPAEEDKAVDFNDFVSFIGNKGLKFLNLLSKVTVNEYHKNKIDDMISFWDKEVNYINSAKEINTTDENFTIDDGLAEAIPLNPFCFENVSLDNLLGTFNNDVISD